MSELSATFGVAAEEELAPGKFVKFSQLKFRILAQFSAWAEARHKEKVEAERRSRIAGLDSCTGLSPYDRGRLILEIQSESRRFDLAAALNEVDGMLYVLWLSAKEFQPSMTIDELGGLLPFARQSVSALLEKLSPAGPETEEDVKAALLGDVLASLKAALAKPCGMADGAGLIQKAVGMVEEILVPPAPKGQPASSR